MAEMDEQLALFDVGPPAKPKKQSDPQKRSWEDGFQKWSNEQALNGDEPYGCCGWGSMCDYCTDNTYGRPCVRALNEMCRERHITVDYTRRNYEAIWDGRFSNGR